MKENNISEAKVFEFEVSKSFFGKIQEGKTIHVICFGNATETDFSFASSDASILSLVEYEFRNESSYYVMQSESVFYVLNKKVYPNCDIYEYADYIGMKENKFIKEVNKIRSKNNRK